MEPKKTQTFLAYQNLFMKFDQKDPLAQLILNTFMCIFIAGILLAVMSLVLFVLWAKPSLLFFRMVGLYILLQTLSHLLVVGLFSPKDEDKVEGK